MSGEREAPAPDPARLVAALLVQQVATEELPLLRAEREEAAARELAARQAEEARLQAATAAQQQRLAAEAAQARTVARRRNAGRARWLLPVVPILTGLVLGKATSANGGSAYTGHNAIVDVIVAGITAIAFLALTLYSRRGTGRRSENYLGWAVGVFALAYWLTGLFADLAAR